MRSGWMVIVLLAATASGCTTVAKMFPRSERPTTLGAALTQNAQLKDLLAAETEVNYNIAYELEVTRIELQKARAGLAAAGAQAAAEVPAFDDFEVVQVKLGILTGLSDWDGEHGYDGFKVTLLTEDSEGTVLKRKGNVLLDLIDISRRSEEVIMTWAVPAEVLGSYWGSLPPGFRVKLPWRGEVPWGDDVVLRATFTDSRGRVFTASRVFTLEEKEPETPVSE